MVPADFSPSGSAVADAVFVVSLVAAARKAVPRIDGWWVVALVAALSLAAGAAHAGDVGAFSRPWLVEGGKHSGLTFVAAYGGWNALKKAIASGMLPTVTGLVCVLALGLGTSGCAAMPPEVRTYIEGTRDLITIAQPCLIAELAAAESACPADAGCRSAVDATREKIADLYDMAHAGWCVLAPSTEGCVK